MFAALLACAALLSGCFFRPSAQMRFFGERFLDTTEDAYHNMLQRQAEVKQKKGITQQEAVGSPAYSLLNGPAEALSLFDTRAREYQHAAKGSKYHARADAEAEIQLEAVRDAFAACALRVNVDVKDTLALYPIWMQAPPDKIVRKVREQLNLKPDANPLADACKKFETAAAAARKHLHLKESKFIKK